MFTVRIGIVLCCCILAGTSARALTLNSDGSGTDVQNKITAADGGRVFLDGVTTSGSTRITSPLGANFSAKDVGKIVSGNSNIPAFALIASVTDSHSADLTVPATSSGSGQSIELGGDTVTLPPGTHTWSSQVTISHKSIQLVALDPASDKTTVIFNSASTIGPLSIDLLSDPTHHQTFFGKGVTWKSQGAFSSMIYIGSSGAAGYPQVAFRISEMKMYGDPLDGVSAGTRFIIDSACYGLVDHCTFISTSYRSAGNVTMGGDSNVTTVNSYFTPVTLGDMNAMYVEDSSWLGPHFNNDAMDNYVASRYVCRYNTIQNAGVGNHGFDSDISGGARTFEIYNNAFVGTPTNVTPTPSGYAALVFRSGTGVVFNNSFTNQAPQANSEGISVIAIPYYYRTLPNSALLMLNRYDAAPGTYWPKGTWGQIPYGGGNNSPNFTFDGFGNRMTGSNPLDGNFFGPGHMDATLSRTVHDLHTTAGSKIITSATINFVSDGTRGVGDDLGKVIRGSNIDYDGRHFSDGQTTNGSATVYSPSEANFSQYDVGRGISSTETTNPTAIPDDSVAGCHIVSVIDAQHAVMDHPAIADKTGVHVVLGGAAIVSITDPQTAVLNIPCSGTTTTGDLTLGYTDEGYPGAYMPGWGSFPSANPGNWPNKSTGYSTSEYEPLDPIYFFNNTINSPHPVRGVQVNQGAASYIKADREYYDQNNNFNGTSGTGSGLLSARPATCTKGVGYYATDVGTQGTLFQCAAPNTWIVKYTPLVYPHPIIANMLGGAPPVQPTNLRISP